MRCRELGRGGFTLVEVVVALAVAGIVLLGARAMLGQLAFDAERIAGAAAGADAEANADRLLRDVAWRLEVAPEEGRRFLGEPAGARFHTWCEVPEGWLERCVATLGILAREGEGVLALTLSTGELVPLRRGFREGVLLYLRDPGEGGAWATSWGRSITAPLALGVVLDGDTTIVRIGERG